MTVYGLAIDPQKDQAVLGYASALWIANIAHVQLHVYALATLMSLNVIEKVTGS